MSLNGGEACFAALFQQHERKEMDSERKKNPVPGAFGNSLRKANAFLRRRPRLWIAGGLVLLTIAVYWPALDSLMVADDFLIVGRWGFDDAIRSLHDTVGFGRNEYRPVIAFSYAISKALWNGAPRGYHLDSIALHAVAAALVYGWLLLLTRSAAISGAAAALFAVHPIHAERVVWITARDSLFSTIFSLLALIAYTLARRENRSLSLPSAFSPKLLFSLSAVFFILGLLSYEGAAVVPILMAALEFFVFGQSEQGFWRRVRLSAARMRWHALILAVYLAWWALLFQGKIGFYHLSYSAGGVLQNYYSYLYHLFHGNSRWAGAVYFLLLISALWLPRERRPLAIFSLAFTLIAYVPFIFIPGFADRFAYAGAAGCAALIALLICGCSRRSARAGRPLALIAFVVLAGYYTLDLRARIDDWLTAGRIAESIPRQIKALHPDLPNGTKLALANIPAMLGHAYVYPVGLDFSIRRFYPGRSIEVIYGPDAMDRIIKEKKPDASNYMYFNYLSDQQAIREVKIN